MTGCRILPYKRRGQLTCVVPPEVPQRGAAAPSVEINKPSANSTGVFVAVTGTRLLRAGTFPRTAGSSPFHADNQDLIQGSTHKGQPSQRRVPKYQGQGLNPVWSAKRQKISLRLKKNREKEKSPPCDKMLLCFLFNLIKINMTTLSICDNTLTWVKHLKFWLRFLYQWGWDRNIPGDESFPRKILCFSELKWSSNTLHLQYQGLVFFHY